MGKPEQKSAIDRNSFHFLLIFSLAIIAFFISIYLVKDHIEDKDESYCDVNSHISCSKVRRSVFSELFKVPVAVFGVLYNIILIAFSLRGFIDSKNQLFISGLFYWCIFGAIFIFYLICAEIYLSALCPFCTLLHIIQFITLFFSWKLYNSQNKPISFIQLLLSLKIWLFFIAFINFLPIIFFNLPQNAQNEPKFDAVPKEFCDCVTFSGWRFYGRTGCGWCEKQKQIFGESIKYIVFIDCANTETACRSLNIDGFPTWIKFTDDGEELDRYKGYSTLENLSNISNCPISNDFLQ